jgi:hypothetical protein
MSNWHTTKNGDRIKLSDLSDSHLDNIIKWIERMAKDGMTVGCGGGHGDIEEMWADFEDIEGDEVLDHLEHEKYVREKKRRLKVIK